MFPIDKASWMGPSLFQKGKYIKLSLIIYNFIIFFRMFWKCGDKNNNFLRNTGKSFKGILFPFTEIISIGFFYDESLMIKYTVVKKMFLYLRFKKTFRIRNAI